MLRNGFSRLPFALLLAWLASSALDERVSAADIDFARDVKPLLSNRCFRCHGPDPAERKGGSDGLRLDSADGILADLGGYAAVVPGKPDESELIRRINSTDPDEVMPPLASGKKLSPQEIASLTAWVRAGAKYSGHWSYRTAPAPELPAVNDESWPRNPIDRFILAAARTRKAVALAQADRLTLNSPSIAGSHWLAPDDRRGRCFCHTTRTRKPTKN